MTRRYTEGALTVDVIEQQTGALVYRARVTDEIGKDLDKQTTRSVDKAFKKFPVKETSEPRALKWTAACRTSAPGRDGERPGAGRDLERTVSPRARDRERDPRGLDVDEQPLAVRAVARAGPFRLPVVAGPHRAL